jgi:hypothetical protein
MRIARLFTLLLPLLLLASCSLAFATPTISVSPTSINASMPGGPCSGNPANQTITIGNSGTGTLSSPGSYATVTYNQGTGWLDVPITGSGNSYTATVEFQNLCTGISDGTYTATISISSSGATNTPVNIPVTLTVGPSSSSISLSSSSLSFNATAGGSNPAAQNVTVSNGGGGTLAAPTTSITYGSGSGWLAVTESGSSPGPYTLSNQVTTGSLAAGTYTATVNVSSSGASNSPASYAVTFTVAKSTTPTISLSQSSVSASMAVDSNDPANQIVTISNSGGGALAYPGEYPTITYNQGSGWLNAPITGSSAPYTETYEFQNTYGLAAGTYTATVQIASSGASNSPVTVPVTLTIGTSSSPVISLSPSSLSFNSTVGGANPAAQSVTVSNGDGGTLAAPTTSITYGSGSGWLAVTESGSSPGPYTLSNQVTTGSLAAGTYTATVSVASSGASNTPQTYTVTFTVAASGTVCELTSPSQDTDSCGPYTYPLNTESNGSNTYVGMDYWNPQSGDNQEQYVTNPGDWYVTFNAPAGGESVLTFPNSEQLYNSETLDSFSALYSSFSITVPTNSGTATDIGFDNWFNNWGNEVMIQNYLVNRGGQCGPVLTTQTFGGSNGVPVNTWVLCQYGSELIWQIQQPSGDPGVFGFTSGSVDILAMNKWLENNVNPNTGSTYLPAGSTITVISYGFELCATNGVNENFAVNSWSVTNN